jgi:hypothetical protein
VSRYHIACMQRCVGMYTYANGYSSDTFGCRFETPPCYLANVIDRRQPHIGQLRSVSMNQRTDIIFHRVTEELVTAGYVFAHNNGTGIRPTIAEARQYFRELHGIDGELRYSLTLTLGQASANLYTHHVKYRTLTTTANGEPSTFHLDSVSDLVSGGYTAPCLPSVGSSYTMRTSDGVAGSTSWSIRSDGDNAESSYQGNTIFGSSQAEHTIIHTLPENFQLPSYTGPDNPCCNTLRDQGEDMASFNPNDTMIEGDAGPRPVARLCRLWGVGRAGHVGTATATATTRVGAWISRNWGHARRRRRGWFGGMQVGLSHVQSDQASASGERDDIKDLVRETRENARGRAHDRRLEYRRDYTPGRGALRASALPTE